jgi:hypothetical protein
MKEQKASLAFKIDVQLAERVRSFCRERGVKYGFFIEKALEERLQREELKEDLLDLKVLRPSEKEAVSLKDYLKDKAHERL